MGQRRRSAGRRRPAWVIPVGRALVAALMVVIVAEGSARWLEPRISHTGDWPPGAIAQQYDLVSRSASTGNTPIDVIFAGSSMTQMGLDPDVFTQRTGLTSINAALPASTNVMVEPWIVDVVAPMLRPRTVVIGVASRDFNDNGDGPQRALAALTTSPGYLRFAPRDWLSRADQMASRFSVLVRSRRSLRDVGNLRASIHRMAPPVRTRGCPPARPDRERYVKDRTVARYPKTVLKDYSAGGRQTQALTTTVRELRRRGIHVALVELPSSPEYRALHPNPDANLAAFETALRSVVDDTGVDLIDGTSLKERRFFRDQIHLNCSGAERLTTIVAHHLR